MRLEDLKKGKSLPGDNGASADHIPDWLDKVKFQRGQDFFKNHISAMIFALHCSLLELFALPEVTVLVYTENAQTPRRALRRYLQTFIHIVLWQLGNVWKKDGRAAASIRRVRQMHKRVAESMNTELPYQGTTRLRVSQYDMAIVQFAFTGPIILHPDWFGIKCSRDEIDDYIHMWRGLGYLLGIRDDYNICSGDTYSEINTLSREIEREVIVSSILNRSEESNTMADTYMTGIGSLLQNWLVLQTKEVVYAYCLEISGIKVHHTLSWPDTLRLWFMKFMVFLTNNLPLWQWLMNKFIFFIFWMNRELVAKPVYLK